MARSADTYCAALRNALRTGRYGGFGSGALRNWRNQAARKQSDCSSRVERRQQKRTAPP